MKKVYHSGNKHGTVLKTKAMRLTVFLLLVSLLRVSANGYSQHIKISLHFDNATVKDVLNTIGKKSDYRIFYKNSEIDLLRRISLKVKKKSVGAILDIVFKNTAIHYKIKNKQIILKRTFEHLTTTLLHPVAVSKAEIAIKHNLPAISPFLQQQEIGGTITDQFGNPLPGVNILIEGTNTGTQTDFDGKYSIMTKRGDVLQFSFLGMKTQKITITTAKTYDLIMEEDAAALKEVVVTALGVRKKTKSLIYNVQKLDSKELTAARDASFMNSLAGKIAGVTINNSASGIGGSTRVIMRGTKSLFGNNNALYVVDGIPLPGLKTDQPNSFYETPDGGDGDGISNINPDDIENISVLTGPAAAALYGSQGANGVVLITTKKGVEGKLSVSYSNQSSFLHPFIIPTLQNTYGSDPGSYDSWGKKLKSPATNQPKDFFKTGVNITNSINLSGGTQRNQTYFSAAAVNATGIIPNNKFNRYNFSIHNTSQLVRGKLTMDVRAGYIRQKDQNTTIQGQYHNPLIPVYLFPRGDDFEKYKVFERFNVERNFKTQYWPHGDLALAAQNPWWIVNRELFNNKKRRYIFSAVFKYTVTEWINATGRANIDDSEVVFTRKIHASSSRLFASDAGNYLNRKRNDNQMYADIILNIDKRFEKFGITANLGASILDYKNDITGYEGHLLRVPNLFSFNNIDRTHGETRPIEGGFHDQTQSVFATAQFSYENSIFLDITARNDWASTLVNTPSQSFLYPSVGLSLVISDILRFSPNIISLLKIRGSYSEVGNPPQRFITITSYPIVNGSPVTSTYASADNLKPERTKSLEVGANIRLLRNRIRLDFTFYNSDTYNQLFRFNAPPSTGYNQFFINAGKVNNHGVEAALEGSVNFGALQWTTNTTFTLNRNEIKELIPKGTIDPLTGKELKVERLVVSSAGTYQMALTEGGSMGDIYTSTLVYDSHGNIKVEPQTESLLVDNDNFVKAGNANPGYNIGFRNNFSYKNFNLSFLIDARIGGIGVSVTRALMDRFGVSENSARARDEGGVLVNGARINTKRYYATVGGGTTGVLSEYVYSATNVRLREAVISYSVPVHLFKGKIKNIDLSVNGRNLFMFYNKAPFDPELTPSTATYYQGIDYFMQPSLRSFGFGVKVTF